MHGASLAELGEILARGAGRVRATVAFRTPRDRPGDWRGGDIWRAAAALPGARVVADPGGVEGLRFGARTSGFVAVYDPSGRLLFAGGITPARGEAGPGAGRDAVIALLDRARIDRAGAPRASAFVFGCPLFDAG